jgi:hydroxybutyrate-dimer hydrolase
MLQNLSPESQSHLSKAVKLEYRGRTVHVTVHRTPNDDLATAGLGREGIASPQPPSFQNPARPTPEELRRRAIYENYRALADTTPGGGYGTFFGPGVKLDGAEVPELLPGVEYRALGEDRSTMVLQISDAFDWGKPVLVLVPASSSRGVYGGIFVAEWALKKGFAVVFTDKGAGTGFHNLTEDIVVLSDGRSVARGSAGDDVTFEAPDSPGALQLFSERHAHRFASKQAHSGLNGESKWGQYVLESAGFALQVLGRLSEGTVSAANTVVIATGLSNGGSASLKACELDAEGLISGVAVGEPNITPVYDSRFSIRSGEGEPLTAHSLNLLEYASVQNLFQPLANLATQNTDAPFNSAPSEQRLKAFQSRGVWRGCSLEQAAQQAQERLRELGLLRDQEALAPSHTAWGIHESLAVNMANAYGRFLVTEHLLGYSFAAVTPNERSPRSLTPGEQATLYARSNGVVPTADVVIVNDCSLGGPVQSLHSISPSTGLPDQNFDGAVGLAALAWGTDLVSQEPLTGQMKQYSDRIWRGAEEIRATGNLRAKPSLIVNGRCDSIISPNHASRSYLGKNLLTEGEKSRLSYIEVVHAQHLDSLNGLKEFGKRYVPLAPYLFSALSSLLKHLQGQGELPPSQVVRSSPRLEQGGRLQPLEHRHIPAPTLSPSSADRIVLVNGVLEVPK